MLKYILKIVWVAGISLVILPVLLIWDYKLLYEFVQEIKETYQDAWNWIKE